MLKLHQPIIYRYEFVEFGLLVVRFKIRCRLRLSSKYLSFGVTVHTMSDSHEIIFKTYWSKVNRCHINFKELRYNTTNNNSRE